MKATEKQKEQMKIYSQRPEIKANRKEYMKNYHSQYKIKNKDKISNRMKKYYINNKERIDKRNKDYMKKHIKEFMAYRKVYDIENKEKLLKTSRDWYYAKDREEYRSKKRVWENNKIKTDLNFAIKKRCRIRIITAFNHYTKTGKIMTAGKYGIDYRGIIDKLITTLPKDFNEREYHIDHIIPCCSFDLTDPEQVKKCFAPENHRWLLAEDNLKKVSSDIKQSLKRRSI